MTARRWAAAAALVALPLVPLPRSCDPRREEVPPSRWAELARFAGTRTRAEVEAALRLIDPQGALGPHHTLTGAAIELRPGGGEPPVRVALRASPAPVNIQARRRVALDPGHFGGAWSRLERRHVSVAGGPPVREGDLTWATARLVERDLRAAGAEVTLLRGPPPLDPFPIGVDPSYDAGREAAFRLAEQRRTRLPWLAPVEAALLAREARRLARDEPFDLFNRFELRRRAGAAEAFAPDVTLSLHYDATLSDTNGVLVFVPGTFVADELRTSSQRFWAFRRALDGSLDETIRLASAMGAALMRRLDLPAQPAAGDASAGQWRPVDPARGVYARNLAILRRTPGVVLLLEGPCVNERREYQRLLGGAVEVDGRRYPARVRQYADAVLEGLRP